MFRLAPLALVLSLSPAAVAGPMSWTFRTTTGTAGVVPTGYLSLPNTDPSQPGGWTRVPGGADGAADGSATITLASHPRGDYRTDAPPPGPGTADRFRVVLEITDGASGLRGFTQFDARGVLLSAGPETGRGEVELQASDRVLIDLGRHRYDISVRGGGGEETARVLADVTVTDLGTANTPEPATLALAGLGLVGVAVRRLRR